MSYVAIKRGITTGYFVLALVTVFPSAARGDQIDDGFNLFDPLPGSQIFVPGLGLLPVVGVPIVSSQRLSVNRDSDADG